MAIFPLKAKASTSSTRQSGTAGRQVHASICAETAAKQAVPQTAHKQASNTEVQRGAAHSLGC